MAAIGPGKKENQDRLQALKEKVGPNKGKTTIGLLSRYNDRIENIERIAESIPPIDGKTLKGLEWVVSQSHTPEDIAEIIPMSVENLTKKRDDLKAQLKILKEEDPYFKNINALREVAHGNISAESLTALEEKKDKLIIKEQKEIRNEIIWDQLPGRGNLTRGTQNYLKNLIERIDKLEAKLKQTNDALSILTHKKAPVMDFMHQMQQQKAGPMSAAAPQPPAAKPPEVGQPRSPEKPKR